MKRLLLSALAIAGLCALAVSCKQLYTTSLASSLANNGSPVSSSNTTSELLAAATSDQSADKTVASGILDALATRPTDVAALSITDKTAVLNLALDATANTSTLLDIAQQAQAGATDKQALIDQAFASFDSTVDLAAVTQILADPVAAASAPVDSLVMASVAVVASVADQVGDSQTVIDIVQAADPAAALAASSLTAAQKADVQTVVDLMDSLNTNRKDELTSLSFGGLNLGDYLTSK